MNTLGTSARRSLEVLRESIAGDVFVPADRGYDEARRAWNLAANQRPAVVVFAQSAADVIQAVRFARSRGIRIAPQGTGHGAAPVEPLEDALLLKTSRMRRVDINAAAETTRAEAGAIWQDVTVPAAEHGLAALAGSSPNVGVTGYTLGGGLGWLARRYGLAANSVTAVEIVTPDGRLGRADAEHEPDLFWAVKGGGGGIGVVTALEMTLYPVSELYAGVLFFPIARSTEVLQAWRDWTGAVPDEVTSIGRILRVPPLPELPEFVRGRAFVLVEAAYLGDAARGAELLRPLRELSPEIDTFATIPAPELQQLNMDPEQPLPVEGDGMLLADAPADVINTLAELTGPEADTPLLSVELRHLGGALAREVAGDGAQPRIDAEYLMYVAGMAPTPEAGDAVRRHARAVKTPSPSGAPTTTTTTSSRLRPTPTPRSHATPLAASVRSRRATTLTRRSCPLTPSDRPATEMSSLQAVKRQPTPASVWQAMAGTTIGDELLEWPPDLFALTEVILQRSEAYRFALSPPAGSRWPPDDTWSDAVVEGGREWSAWVAEGTGELPDLLAREWKVFRDAGDTPLEQLTEAHDWRLCESLLTLHAIADEACAGLGVALTASDGNACVYRARARELLARTGTLARIPPDLVRVLPKVRTSPTGSSSRSLSRYACVHGPGVEARWHKIPGRRPGTDPHAQGANFLLLPWPLRVRESDFRPVEGSVRSLAKEPFGFFEFVPSEGLDLDMVDRMLIAAKDEVDNIDVVCLPESAVEESELDDLEALLHRHGVPGLVTGVRRRPQQPGQLPRNWVQIAQSTGEHWLRIRQNKHHRWSLDQEQIYQYHLGGALHPHIRWWEAMAVPRRSVQFVEVGEGVTVVSLVCEDLAQIDDVADLLRSVGPTLVITPLLDGPQLSSRWAARYASVLADNPGSAVLTLTSAGMARRSRPHGRGVSPVIALWKDPVRGTREISLEGDAQGVLLTASADLATRRSGDGRQPVDNCTEFFDMGVHQVRAANGASSAPTFGPTRPTPAVLEADELTVLTSWAEAIAEVLAYVPERAQAVLADALPGAPWRAALGIAEPSPPLSRAIDSMQTPVRSAIAAADEPTLSGVLLAAVARGPGEHELDALARRVLQSALEQRQVRLTRTGRGGHRRACRSRPHGVTLLDVDLTGGGPARRASPEPLPS